MRKLGIHAAFGAALLTIAATTAPVAAQAPDVAPAGATTTVRTDCTGDPGTIVVRQTLLESGSTRVVVLGHGVRNGRWAGGFSPEASSTEGQVDIDVRAVHHELRTSFVVDDVSADTNTTLVQSFSRACAVGETLRPRTTSITSATIALVARHPDADRLTTAALVSGCENGSRWRYTISAEFADSTTGEGRGGLVCRNDLVRIPRSTTAGGDGAPTALSLVARSGDDVRRISYRTSRPAR